MSRVFTGVANQYLGYAGTMGITGAPFSLFAWIKYTASTSGNGVYYRNAPATSNFIGTDVDGSAHIRGLNYQTNSTNDATTATLTINTWYPVLVVYNASLGGELYALGETITGSFPGAFIAESSPTFEIGDSTGYQSIQGKIAHATFYNVDMSANYSGLAAGAVPSSYGGCIAYWPLTDTSLTDTVGSKVLTVNGTIASDAADNPPVGSTGGFLNRNYWWNVVND